MNRNDALVFKLDEYLASKKTKTFTQSELVEALGLHPKDASGLIQNFMRRQKVEGWTELLNSRIYRVPGTRTAAAVWTHGDRPSDVKQVVKQAADDFKTRSEELASFLESVQASNSRSAKAIRQANLLLATAVSVLEHAEY